MSSRISRGQFIKRSTAAAAGLMVPWPGISQSMWGGAPSTTDVWRGSWVQRNKEEAGDLLLAGDGLGCHLVLGPKAASAVQQAARFLAADIQKISGYLPPIVPAPVSGTVNIRLATLGMDEIPAGVAANGWETQPEAFRIVTIDRDLWLAGADFRGTAFAVYTLSERLGIDPLYWWTGYEPQQFTRLVLKRTDYQTGPPAFRYRGFFHDDEDILPRPFGDNGYPLLTGDVPLEWYQRFFETALRLRMNMVAPYTRVHRREEVQRCASDWGLHYTSHHYDILLSNPFGIERFNLAEKRKVDHKWDWFNNRKGMTDYWKGGVEENKDFYTIWPVGLRGTDDRAYTFPPGTTPLKEAQTFREVLDTQVQMVTEALPQGHPPLFHFTLYTEMLEQYLHNKEAFDVPENVIIVWPDNNNGVMRQLPTDRGKWKHGVYYHLAYYGGNESKQALHTVAPLRIAEQFDKILAAGATEFMLVNTSELREFVMEARMIARICWEGKSMYPVDTAGLSPAAVADAYTNWWAREYFGGHEATITALYRQYYQLFDDAPTTWFGTDRVEEMLDLLYRKFTHQPYHPPADASLKEWTTMHQRYASAVTQAEKTASVLERPAAQFLFEQLTLGLLWNACTLECALILARALTAPGETQGWAHIMAARKPLEELELAILRAERPPFEKWYRETWIRNQRSRLNLHRPYSQLRAFVAEGGKASPRTPAVQVGHNIPDAQRWTRFLEERDKPAR
ncbi:MAG TPA: glycosyl hydrolase 115 family protein [Puia sp.]